MYVGLFLAGLKIGETKRGSKKATGPMFQADK
jgi:hypothetical protein